MSRMWWIDSAGPILHDYPFAGAAATAGSYVKSTADGIESLSNQAAEGVKGTLGETVRAPLFTPCRALNQNTFAPF